MVLRTYSYLWAQNILWCWRLNPTWFLSTVLFLEPPTPPLPDLHKLNSRVLSALFPIFSSMGFAEPRGHASGGGGEGVSGGWVGGGPAAGWKVDLGQVWRLFSRNFTRHTQGKQVV